MLNKRVKDYEVCRPVPNAAFKVNSHDWETKEIKILRIIKKGLSRSLTLAHRKAHLQNTRGSPQNR
jgi:hypothetical protein